MIESLEQYRAGEQKLKELLSSLSAAGDMIDAEKTRINKDGDNWQGVSERIASLKKELSDYRTAHPQEFTN